MMGIKVYPKCYFYTLLDSERGEVHTIDGRRKLEVGAKGKRYLLLYCYHWFDTSDGGLLLFMSIQTVNAVNFCTFGSGAYI